MSVQSALNFNDLRRGAKRRLPKGIFEYIDRGTEDETAIRHTRACFDNLRFAPRALVTGEISLKTTLFGEEYAMPFLAAPTAFTGLVWHQGEIALAQACSAAGIGYCAATSSITPVQDIAAATPRAPWFQLYLSQQGELWRVLVQRAWDSGVRTLVLTVDTNVGPNREFNTRNGFGMPLTFGARNVFDVLSHPRWAAGVLGKYLRAGGLPVCGNYPPDFQAGPRGNPSAPKLNHHPDLSWDHVATLRETWKGNLVIKGILRPEDALRAADLGADGIVVSSHGARNIDSSVTPIDALPAIAEASQGRLVILADSGVQRGSDVFKLLARGAQAVLVGRAFLYGTAMGGRAGAERAITILQDELRRTMILSGYRDTRMLASASSGSGPHRFHSFAVTQAPQSGGDDNQPVPSNGGADGVPPPFLSQRPCPPHVDDGWRAPS